MSRARMATAVAISLACTGISARAGAQCHLFPTGGYVGIFGDREGTQATILFPNPQHADTLYVLAVLDSATSDGFTGVQFRIEVTEPDGWFFTPKFTAEGHIESPSVFDVEPNNPDNPAGILLSWNACQTGMHPGPGQIVTIGTLVVFTATGASTDLLIKRKLPPTNPGAPCARFDRCDAPNFSRAPMPAREVDSHGEEIVFRTRLVRGDVPVQQDTWGQIKKLYSRN